MSVFLIWKLGNLEDVEGKDPLITKVFVKQPWLHRAKNKALHNLLENLTLKMVILSLLYIGDLLIWRICNLEILQFSSFLETPALDHIGPNYTISDHFWQLLTILDKV